MNQKELEKALAPWIVAETKEIRLEGTTAFSYEVILHDEWRCKLTLGIRRECMLIVIACPNAVQAKSIPVLLPAINQLNLDMAEGCVEIEEVSRRIQYRSCLIKTSVDPGLKELQYFLVNAFENAYICFSHLEAVLKNTGTSDEGIC